MENIPQNQQIENIEKVDEQNQQQSHEDEFYTNYTKPFIISTIIFKHPWIVILSAVGLTIILGSTVFITGKFEVSESMDRDYLVWSDFHVERQDSVELAEEEVDKWKMEKYLEDNPNSNGYPERRQQIDDLTTLIIYESTSGDNVFTPENIKQMQKIEANLLARDDQKFNKFCIAKSDTDTSCDSSSFFQVTDLFGENWSENQISYKLQSIANNDDDWSEKKILFGKDFDKENLKSKLTRSLFMFAFPLNIDGVKYKDINDQEADQKKKWAEWMYDYYEWLEDQSTSTMKVYIYARKLSEYTSMKKALNDGCHIFLKQFLVNWIYASFAFILVYMIIHTRHWLYPSTGMLQIILSLPLSLAFYYYVLQVDYFSQMALVILFLILGISADNIFIYVDTWKQSGQIKCIQNDIEKRFTFTYKKAIRQISTTSSTTFFNFLMTALSKIMPIATFGFFACSLVLVNYLLVLSFFPATFIFYEQCKQKNIQKKKLLEISAKKDRIEPESNNQNGQQNNIELEKIQINPKNDNQSPPQNENIQNELQKDTSDKLIGKYNIIERFFYEKWSCYVFKFRWIILGVFLAWFILTIVFTAHLQAPPEITQSLPEKNIIAKGEDRALSFYSGQNDDVIKVYFYWGIAGLNKDTIESRWDSDDRGTVIWDDKFDITLPSTQSRIAEICDDLEKNYAGGELILEDGVNCFMLAFRDYCQTNSINFPVSSSSFMSIFMDFTSSSYGEDYLSDNSIGIINEKIKFVKIKSYGTTTLISEGKFQKTLFDKWEDLMNKYNKGSPEGCNKALQTAGFGWEWMITEETLIKSTIMSLIYTGIFAFFVLAISTQNWIISIISTVSIFGIVIGILGLIKMFGWYLGLIESITAGIVVGFSVEYVVFICINYLIIDLKTRFEKVRQTLLNMGISIIGGAITTLGAGLFLLFGEIEFFPKMGKLLICTIISSLFWALLLFSAVLMIVGPLGKQGSLIVIFYKIKSLITKKKE